MPRFPFPCLGGVATWEFNSPPSLSAEHDSAADEMSCYVAQEARICFVSLKEPRDCS